MNDDPSILKTLLDWSWAGVVGLIGVLWKVNTSQHDKHRDTQKLIFEKLDEHKKEDQKLFMEVTKQMNDGFKEVTTIIHQHHVDVLRALPRRKEDS